MGLQLVILSSPSGAGKSTLAARLIHDPDLTGYHFSISHTTRASRGEEVDGRDYWFVTEEEFDRIGSLDGFAEHATVHGHRYGTSLAEMERISAIPGARGIVFDIDWQGARDLRRRFPLALAVFILPPGHEELRQRLTRRGTEDEESLVVRLGNATMEIAHHREFDQVIVNDDLDRAYGDLRSIVIAHAAGGAPDRREQEERGRRLAAEMLAKAGGEGAA